MVTRALLPALVVAVASGTLPAADARASGWHLTAEVITDAPVDVGARAALEGPWRLRLSTSLGVMPGPYVDIINAVVVAAGGYDDATADLIAGSLSASMVWRTHAGWRPFRRLGFYVDAGYGLVAFGGGVGAQDALSAISGRPPPMGDGGSGHEYDVVSTLHMLDVEVGWQWHWPFGLAVRAAVGFAGTVAASTTVEPRFQPRAPQLDAMFRDSVAAYLDDTYTSYVFTPVVTLGAGYRFM